MKKLCLLIAMMICFLNMNALCAVMESTVIYSDGFDDFNVGESFIGGNIVDVNGGLKTVVYAPNEGGVGESNTDKVLKFGSTGGVPGFYINFMPDNTGVTKNLTVTFKIYFENPTHSIRIPELYQKSSDGYTYAFEAISTSNLIGLTGKDGSIYNKTTAVAKHWYDVKIESDVKKNTFSVSYDGVKVQNSSAVTEFLYKNPISYINSIFFGYKNIKNTTDAYAYINDLKIVSSSECSLKSDELTISNDNIYGVNDKMTANDVISALEYEKGSNLHILNKSGLERSSYLRAGDYLEVRTEKSSVKYNFPELMRDSLYSQFCNINTTNLTISAIGEGVTANTLAGSLESDFGLKFDFYDRNMSAKDMDAVIVNNDKLRITYNNDVSYDFTLYTKPEKNCMLKEDFSDEQLDNWYFNDPNNGAMVENSALKLTDSQRTLSEMRRYFTPTDEKFVIECSISYNVVDEDVIVYGPYFENEANKLGRIKLVNGLIYFGDVNDKQEELDCYSGIEAENNRKYFYKIVIDPKTHEFDLYIDNVLIDTGIDILDSLTDINCLTFKIYNENKSGNNSASIDDIRVYKPFTNISGINYDKESDKVNLLLSSDSIAPQNIQIYDSMSQIVDSVMFEDEENKKFGVVLTSPLKDDNYVLTVNDNKSYMLSVGKTDYEICYCDLFSDNEGIKAEYAVRNNSSIDKNAKIFIVLYDENNRVVATSEDNMLIDGNSLCDSQKQINTMTINPSYMKIFCWDGENNIIPLCKAFFNNMK